MDARVKPAHDDGESVAHRIERSRSSKSAVGNESAGSPSFICAALTL
jgi:hypothetical protein